MSAPSDVVNIAMTAKPRALTHQRRPSPEPAVGDIGAGRRTLAAWERDSRRSAPQVRTVLPARLVLPDLGFQFTAVPGRFAWCEPVAPSVAPNIGRSFRTLALAPAQPVDE
jgi:hypothetical protein